MDDWATYRVKLKIFKKKLGINGTIGNLHRIDGHLDSHKYVGLLRRYICPLENEMPDFCFMQDNSSVHASNETNGFLSRQTFRIVPFPAYSPDLNVIEHVWAYIVHRWPEVNVRHTISVLNRLRNETKLTNSYLKVRIMTDY